MEEEVTRRVVGSENVCEAVIVIIGDCHAHPFAEMAAHTGFFGDVGKSPVAVVAIQSVGEGIKLRRVAVDAKLAPLGPAERVFVEPPDAIIRHEQIEQAVVVVIKPGGTNGPNLAALGADAADSCRKRHVSERAVTLVVKELVVVDADDVEILPAVVVVVPRGHAH